MPEATPARSGGSTPRTLGVSGLVSPEPMPTSTKPGIRSAGPAPAQVLGWHRGWEYLVPGTLDGVSVTFAFLAFRAVRKQKAPDRSTAEGFGGPYTSGSAGIGTAIIYALVFAGLQLLPRPLAPQRRLLPRTTHRLVAPHRRGRPRPPRVRLTGPHPTRPDPPPRNLNRHPTPAPPEGGTCPAPSYPVTPA